jgi:hypothetical protein
MVARKQRRDSLDRAATHPGSQTEGDAMPVVGDGLKRVSSRILTPRQPGAIGSDRFDSTSLARPGAGGRR